MIEIKGKFNIIKCFAEEIEETALEQLETISNYEPLENSNIRIMPDVHGGAGCVIGFTSKLIDKVIPNIIGVDIGCGVLSYEIENFE